MCTAAAALPTPVGVAVAGWRRYNAPRRRLLKTFYTAARRI